VIRQRLDLANPGFPPRSALAALAALLVAAPLAAQTCPNAPAACDRSGCAAVACATPAVAVPQAYWGELQPATPACSPLPGDVTGVLNQAQAQVTSFFDALDLQNGFVFTGAGYGMQVWDVHTTPASPQLLGSLTYGQFPYSAAGNEVYEPIQSISAPPGVDTMAAISAASGNMGILIVDLTQKASPKIAYQGYIDSAFQVYAAKIAGTNYAFMATQSPTGVYLFNMDQALRGAPGCVESVASPGQCPGVALGAINRQAAAEITGVDNFLAVAGGTSAPISIYDVSSPLSPQLKASGLGDVGSVTSGVAMWKDAAGKYYLAARGEDAGGSDTLSIFDVSCITGTCSGLGTLLYQTTFPGPVQGKFFISASSSNGTSFLYLGREFTGCAQGPQQEWLLDVSNPSAPRDVTPPSVGGSGYWGWYYRGNPTGFNAVTPRMGKFNGAYFYRAAHNVFDVHQWVGVTAPAAAFTFNPPPPAPIYPGAPVSFTSQSTGGQLSYSWTFQDGSPATSNLANPAVTFPAHTSYPFNETVTLTVTNGRGTSTVTKTVTVADPSPQIASISVAPAGPLQCQPVTLTANATGQAPLGYSWTILDSNNVQVTGGTSTSNPFTWDTKAAGAAAGSYTANITVSNTASKSASQGFSLGKLPALVASAPTADSFTSGTVQFHVTAAGATEWNWNFGDNSSSGWTNDPVAGPNPSHTYTAIGTYAVTVQVRNCVPPSTPATSAPLSVQIVQVTPLLANFVPGCTNSLCTFGAGSPVTFTDRSSGAQAYYYDWEGTGAFDTGHNAPVTQHTYPNPGHYYPALRVTRGTSESNTFVLPPPGIIINPAAPPGITVSGAAQGTIGQPYTYNAFASNCTPDPNGWSWSAGGGTGSSTTSSITVTWGSAGSYSVSASNSGCGSASGSVGVSISGNNTNLQAVFTFSPQAPNSGDSVAFDGSASTGSPTAYNWFFGDGATATGAQASHAYTQPGSYTVKLDVSAPGNCPRNVCISEQAQTVTVGGGTSLKAAFTFSPQAPKAGDTVAFDGTASTGSPTAYDWFFGDGATASGAKANHVYSQPGSYTVKLDVSAPGNCPQNVCINETAQAITVAGTSPQPLNPAYTSASCTGTPVTCQATAGQSVTLSAVETRATGFAWDFGDGTTGSGNPVSHTWPSQGSYAVALTVSAPQFANQTSTQTFQVQAATPTSQSVVLPWVAQTRGALVQSCDLYLHNPGGQPEDVTLQFLKRGRLEDNPPRATVTIQPGATMYAPNVLQSVFSRQDISGFVMVTVKATDPLPVITSFNTVVRTDGGQFGQTVPGLPLPKASAASSTSSSSFQYLIGLNDNSDQLAYFGVTNPSSTSATYHVRLLDHQGSLIGESKGDLTIGPFAQRQYQQEDVHNLFGLTSASDYVVSVENKSGNVIFPYGENVRLVSNDPSFINAGTTGAVTQYVIGAFSTAGSWQTDVVLTNTSTQPVALNLTFTRPGVLATTTAPVALTLAPGQSQRLSNAIAGQWNLNNVVGVIAISTASASGPYPLVQAESYNNAQPANRYGQSMGAFAGADAAQVGQGHYLTGLRQDATHLTTVWLYNPSSDFGVYDVVYRALDGTVLGTVSNFSMPPGRLKQFLPAQHPLPAGGAGNGFTVQVLVKSGAALTAAQVLTTTTGDPAYIQGAAR
jgi:PKD repeat protein